MSSRGRGRGGFHPSHEIYDEPTERSARNRQQFFAEEEYQNSSRNFVNEMNLGNSRPRQDPQFNQHPSADGGRMQQFMPDPRLVHHSNQYKCHPGGNPCDDFNRKGKSLRPLNNSEMNHSFNLCNEESLVGVTRLTKEIPLEVKHVDRRYVDHTVDERFERRLPIGMPSSKPSDPRTQVNLNLDSIVHNLLDSFQLDVNDERNLDNQLHREEEEEEPDDFPSRVANYQRSFNDVEQFAIALPSDTRLNNSSVSSTQSKSKSSTRENQPTARVKPEPRETSGALVLDQNLENNLKKALEDIRQRQMTTSHSSYSENSSSKESRKTSSESKKTYIPSNPKSKGPSPESSDQREKSRRTVVENVDGSSTRNKSRSSRNHSPSRGRDFPVLGSPEWHRQVRIVDKADRHRDSREREMRRVRRARSKSRSRSRSRSPRRTQRYFRLGSPERRRTRSRSRSRSSRRGPRMSRSPDLRSSRRLSGSGRLSRNSRSPPRIRDRRRSPTEYIHRNVIERTVIMRHRSRSYSPRSRSRSPSKSSSVSAKRYKESHDSSNSRESQPQANQAESPVATTQINQTAQHPQFFTRGYVAANNQQADYVAQPQQVPPQVSTRYVIPPAQPIGPPVAAPPMINFYNQHFQQPHHQMMFQQQQFQQQQQQQHFHQQQFYQQQQQLQKQQHFHNQMSQSVLSYIKPLASFNPNVPPAVPVSAPAVPTASNAETISADVEQRIRHTRDSLLEKQTHLIHQLFVLQGQQADLEMRQKTADGNEYERYSSNLVEKAKLEKELIVSAQALQKIIQKYTTQLKEDLCELKKARCPNRYSYFDPGQHWCELCDVITEKLPDYLTHLHSKEHEERLQSTGVPSTPWHKKRQAAIEEEKSDSRIITRIPFNGLQCLQPVKAWYCEMCDVWMGDVHCAQLHMNSNEHNDQHLKRSMDRPEAALNHTIKKQAALRRNSIRKKDEERVRNQKREADRLKMEAQKKEELKKKEEELQEKQKMLTEKWQNFVRQEESINVGIVELEEESSGPSTVGVQRSEEVASSTSTPNVNKNIRLNMRTRLMSTKSMEQDGGEKLDDATSSHSVKVVDSVEGKSISQQGETVTTTTEKSSNEVSVIDNSLDLSNKSVVEKASSGLDNNEDSNQLTTPQVSDVPELTDSGVDSAGAADVQQEGGGSSLIDLANTDAREEVNEAENRLPNTKLSKECVTSDVDQPAGNALETVSQESHGAEKDECHEMDFDVGSTLASPEKMETSENTCVAEPLANAGQQQMVSREVRSKPTLLSTDNVVEKFNQEQSIIAELQLKNSHTGLDSMATQLPKETSAIPAGIVEHPEDNSGILVNDNVKESHNVVDVVCQQDSPPDEEKLCQAGGSEESLVPKIEPKDSSTCEEPLDCCVIMEVNPKLTKVVEVIDLEPSSDESDHSVEDDPSKDEKNANSTVLSTGGSGEKGGGNASSSDDRSSLCNKSEISVQLSDFIVLSETNDDSFVEPECAFHSPEPLCTKQVEPDNNEPVSASTPVP